MKAFSSRRGWSCIRRREATTGASGASDAKTTSLWYCSPQMPLDWQHCVSMGMARKRRVLL